VRPDKELPAGSPREGDHALKPQWQIYIHEKRRLLHTTQVAGSLELGRQIDAEEGLFDLQPGAGRARLAIARFDEPGFSRKHILLTPLADGQVRVENLSTALSVFLAGSNELKPGSHCEIRLPVFLTIEPKVIRVEAAQPELESVQLRSLREAPAALAVTMLAARFPAGKVEVKGQVDSQELLVWLQTIMGVFLSTASSGDFFTKAAQAVVDVVGLDSGRVLLRDNEAWRTEAIHTSPRVPAESNWQASRSVLARVVEEKRTFWEVPPAVASLKAIKAVVAAPILGGSGEVVAVLYGDSRLSGEASGAALIT
jgi:hypothetical protein